MWCFFPCLDPRQGNHEAEGADALLITQEEERLLRPEVARICKMLRQQHQQHQTSKNNHEDDVVDVVSSETTKEVILSNSRRKPLNDAETRALFASLRCYNNNNNNHRDGGGTMKKLWVCVDGIGCTVDTWNSLSMNGLEELRLWGTLPEQACAAIGRELSSRPTTVLRSLVLSGNDIRDEGAHALGRALLESKPPQHQSCTLQKLVLSFNRISNPTSIGWALMANHTAVRELSLSYNDIQAGGAATLARALRKNQTLHTLDLSGNSDMTWRGGRAIADSLHEDNHTLRVLLLNRCQLSREGGGGWKSGNFVDTHLTRLELCHNFVGNDGATMIGQELRDNHRLVELRLSGNRIGNVGSQAIGRALSVNRTLQILVLSNNHIADGGSFHIGQGLSNNQTLRILWLDNNRVGDFGCMAIGHALGGDNEDDDDDNNNNNNNCSALTHLYLSQNSVGDVGGRIIGNNLAKNQTLRILKLDKNNLGDAAALAIGEGIASNQTLQELWLDNNEIGDEGAEAISRGIVGKDNDDDKTRRCKLTKLWLSHNNIGDAGALGIGQALRGNPSLISLGLDNNSIGSEGAGALAQGLARNETLKELWISHNRIESRGMASFGACLANNRALSDLRLESNGTFRGDCLRQLGQSLASNVGLKGLWLSSNHIDDVGLDDIFRGLAHNSALGVLILGFNEITEAGLMAVQQHLAGNYTLREFGFVDNHFDPPTSDALPKIQAMLNRNQTGMWKLLRLDCSPSSWPLILSMLQSRENSCDLCFDILRNRPEIVGWRG